MQNGFIERLNGSFRKELFNAYVFKTISEVRGKVKEWMDDYNYERPHQSLGYRAPIDLL
jgi:putative transposase